MRHVAVAVGVLTGLFLGAYPRSPSEASLSPLEPVISTFASATSGLPEVEGADFAFLGDSLQAPSLAVDAAGVVIAVQTAHKDPYLKADRLIRIDPITGAKTILGGSSNLAFDWSSIDTSPGILTDHHFGRILDIEFDGIGRLVIVDSDQANNLYYLKRASIDADTIEVLAVLPLLSNGDPSHRLGPYHAIIPTSGSDFYLVTHPDSYDHQRLTFFSGTSSTALGMPEEFVPATWFNGKIIGLTRSIPGGPLRTLAELGPGGTLVVLQALDWLPDTSCAVTDPYCFQQPTVRLTGLRSGIAINYCGPGSTLFLSAQPCEIHSLDLTSGFHERLVGSATGSWTGADLADGPSRSESFAGVVAGTTGSGELVVMDYRTIAATPFDLEKVSLRRIGRQSALTAGQVLEFDAVGVAGVPTDASAVVVNITAVDPEADGYLTVYPCGEAIPNTSNLNYQAGQTIPNLVIARPGVGGKICVYTYATAGLLADISGFFPAGSDYTAITNPQRVLDTREVAV